MIKSKQQLELIKNLVVYHLPDEAILEQVDIASIVIEKEHLCAIKNAGEQAISEQNKKNGGSGNEVCNRLRPIAINEWQLLFFQYELGLIKKPSSKIFSETFVKKHKKEVEDNGETLAPSTVQRKWLVGSTKKFSPRV